jgi:hypothetical protein
MSAHRKIFRRKIDEKSTKNRRKIVIVDNIGPRNAERRPGRGRPLRIALRLSADAGGYKSTKSAHRRPMFRKDTKINIF